MSAAQPVTSVMTIGTDMKIEGNGATIAAPINVIGANVEINNINFNYAGDNSSAGSNGIVASGNKNFTLTNSTIAGTMRKAIIAKTSGAIVISGNTFNSESGSIYNAVETGLSSEPAISALTIENNTFNGSLGNNAISLFKFEEGATVNIKNNTFNLDNAEGNTLRLSNMTNAANVVFNIIDNEYAYPTDDANEWSGFMICQVLPNGSTNDFKDFVVNITNLTYKGEKLTTNGEGVKRICYIWDVNNGMNLEGISGPVFNFN